MKPEKKLFNLNIQERSIFTRTTDKYSNITREKNPNTILSLLININNQKK